ncbi:MAG: hypothetical protein F6K17_07660 [Okeania sp. SIO3C4]|nr:hypothetical protein [Okeania sp. SIO3B3]NER02510.1 hypothetical protein [Okeania sp. SIO3C4]
MIFQQSLEEGRRQKAEGRRQKEKLHGDSLRHATPCLQTRSNFKQRVNGGVISVISYQLSVISY